MYRYVYACACGFVYPRIGLWKPEENTQCLFFHFISLRQHFSLTFMLAGSARLAGFGFALGALGICLSLRPTNVGVQARMPDPNVQC